MHGLDAALPIDSLAHLIQVALTPVFLLSGIASLLNVFAGRLARVSDRLHIVTAALDTCADDARGRLTAELRYLRGRSYLLDAAALLGTCGGAATCAAALLLFFGSLRDTTLAGLTYASFAVALLATILALVSFMTEVLIASRGVRRKQQTAMRRAVPGRGDADSAI